VNNGAFWLAETGMAYVVYLPHGGAFIARVELGRMVQSGSIPAMLSFSSAGIAEGATWQSPLESDNEDWVLLLARTQAAG
jgi:hypothetical protein